MRVPVVTGHGINASMWFERAMTLSEARDLLAKAPGVEVWDDTVPTPLDSAGLDATLATRLGRGK